MCFVQSLATAIAATKGLSVKQVVKNENGEEVGVAVAFKYVLKYVFIANDDPWLNNILLLNWSGQIFTCTFLKITEKIIKYDIIHYTIITLKCIKIKKD